MMKAMLIIALIFNICSIKYSCIGNNKCSEIWNNQLNALNYPIWNKTILENGTQLLSNVTVDIDYIQIQNSYIYIIHERVNLPLIQFCYSLGINYQRQNFTATQICTQTLPIFLFSDQSYNNLLNQANSYLQYNSSFIQYINDEDSQYGVWFNMSQNVSQENYPSFFDFQSLYSIVNIQYQPTQYSNIGKNCSFQYNNTTCYNLLNQNEILENQIYNVTTSFQGFDNINQMSLPSNHQLFQQQLPWQQNEISQLFNISISTTVRATDQIFNLNESLQKILTEYSMFDILYNGCNVTTKWEEQRQNNNTIKQLNWCESNNFFCIQKKLNITLWNMIILGYYQAMTEVNNYTYLKVQDLAFQKIVYGDNYNYLCLCNDTLYRFISKAGIYDYAPDFDNQIQQYMLQNYNVQLYLNQSNLLYLHVQHDQLIKLQDNIYQYNIQQQQTEIPIILFSDRIIYLLTDSVPTAFKIGGNADHYNTDIGCLTSVIKQYSYPWSKLNFIFNSNYSISQIGTDLPDIVKGQKVTDFDQPQFQYKLKNNTLLNKPTYYQTSNDTNLTMLQQNGNITEQLLDFNYRNKTFNDTYVFRYPANQWFKTSMLLALHALLLIVILIEIIFYTTYSIFVKSPQTDIIKQEEIQKSEKGFQVFWNQKIFQ